MESTAAAMAKAVVQITLTGTTNKVRKMKVPSSLQPSLVPLLAEPIKEPAGKRLVSGIPGQHHKAEWLGFIWGPVGRACYCFVFAEKQ